MKGATMIDSKSVLKRMDRLAAIDTEIERLLDCRYIIMHEVVEMRGAGC